MHYTSIQPFDNIAITELLLESFPCKTNANRKKSQMRTGPDDLWRLIGALLVCEWPWYRCAFLSDPFIRTEAEVNERSKQKTIDQRKEAVQTPTRRLSREAIGFRSGARKGHRPTDDAADHSALTARPRCQANVSYFVLLKPLRESQVCWLHNSRH